ncbi:PREDICTED: GATA zinc finger domain-containing protein 14-like [Dufourea novaeangliae]|uniref:Coiled-coil domain-containing protein 9 n=1 Tax=Dufourea novaeangliae TaxID=178035 RepID=A0A154PRU8_DUFNO|nr:PREDICTED: GATA zinc finger domain-containing protein 14-like [Dufourea novaeangliae]KZC13998.1 hypothetical protein WN55_06528 [Dufourea novaeangliae]
MASSALEEKINKIRQQNEEIRRRYEEVEEDKKNAAKLNALVQMVPSSDWPERKEPPEFSTPPKVKQKSAKEKYEYQSQAHSVEGKKTHSFAQGEGPPPDPKYNFLADSEREEHGTEYTKESSGNRSHNKVTRGSFRKKTGGRENHLQKDNKVHKGNYRDESQPGYDAWRAERNRIDEDRISRQRTAEGNWRREWDNDKIHIVDDVTKKATRSTLGDSIKKDHKESDRRYHSNNNEHTAYNRGGNRPHRGSSKNFYGSYDSRSHNTYDQHRNNSTMPTKAPLSPTSEERTVIATEKSIKVTVNQGSTTKGPVMSVKVNSPSIAGTGRVGPRQRSRVTYSHSDAEAPVSESELFHRQKSFEDKSKATYFNNQKSPNVKRSHSQKKKDGETKYPYNQRKENRSEDDNDVNSQTHVNQLKSLAQKDLEMSPTDSSNPITDNTEPVKQDLDADSPGKNGTEECSNVVSVKLENNVVTENKKSSEASKSDLSNQIKSFDTNSEEEKVKDEGKNDISKIEMVEGISTSLLEVKNSEQINEDDKNTISSENKNKCSQEFANSVAENLLETNDVSSEALVPNNTESKVESVPDESNNVSNNIIAVEEVLIKNDQESLKQVNEQIVNNDCDNIKDETAVQRRRSTLENEINSVINIKDQLICSNESVEKETLVADESIECSDKKLENTVHCNEINTENHANCNQTNTESTLSNSKLEDTANCSEMNTENHANCNEMNTESTLSNSKLEDTANRNEMNTENHANCNETNTENTLNNSTDMKKEKTEDTEGTTGEV